MPVIPPGIFLGHHSFLDIESEHSLKHDDYLLLTMFKTTHLTMLFDI